MRLRARVPPLLLLSCLLLACCGHCATIKARYQAVADGDTDPAAKAGGGSLEDLLQGQVLGALHEDFEITEALWVGCSAESQRIIKTWSQQAVKVVTADPEPDHKKFGSKRQHLVTPLAELISAIRSLQFDVAIVLAPTEAHVSSAQLQAVLEAAYKTLRNRGWLVLGWQGEGMTSTDLRPHFLPARLGSLPPQIGSGAAGWRLRLYRKTTEEEFAASSKAVAAGSSGKEQPETASDTTAHHSLGTAAHKRVQMPASKLGANPKPFGHSLRRL